MRQTIGSQSTGKPIAPIFRAWAYGNDLAACVSATAMPVCDARRSAKPRPHSSDTAACNDQRLAAGTDRLHGTIERHLVGRPRRISHTRCGRVPPVVARLGLHVLR